MCFDAGKQVLPNVSEDSKRGRPLPCLVLLALALGQPSTRRGIQSKGRERLNINWPALVAWRNHCDILPSFASCRGSDPIAKTFGPHDLRQAR
ncbi:14531_t:CDS:2 [Acaulospora colombiana]|uniref:14531_t:CDS:1 n=1 Tax=Acaulospora colombiana TaxID=27376 RepID=A0ACA9MCT6_9GLOM|nr:14531_t:CDS:2 [Acaulospora colombiana]